MCCQLLPEQRQLFVGGEVMESMDGTTQGDPLSMAIYALATSPLIARARESIPSATQWWFADDARAAGRQRCLLSWWTKLETDSHLFGYDVNPPKTWLFVRDEHLQEARELFGLTGINITTEGRPVLGSPCGREEYCRSFCSSKVEQWVSKVSARFAKTQPHAAHAAFTHGLSSEWTYLSRSVCNLWKNTRNRWKKSSAVISCPLLRDEQSATLSGTCSASRLVSEEWPCAILSMKHTLTLTRPLRSLPQWCSTFVALMKTAATSWRPLAYSVKDLSWAGEGERLPFRRRRKTSTASLIPTINAPCHSCKKRVPRFGWRPFRWMSLRLLSHGEISVMRSVWDTVGNLRTCPAIAQTESHSLWNTLWAAVAVATCPFATMKSETSSWISCRTLVKTSPPSLICNPSVESSFSQRQQSLLTKPVTQQDHRSKNNKRRSRVNK